MKSAFAANQTFCLRPLLSLLLLLLVAPPCLESPRLEPQRYRLYQFVSAVVRPAPLPTIPTGTTQQPSAKQPIISKSSITLHKSNHRRYHHHGEEDQARGQGPVPAISVGQ